MNFVVAKRNLPLTWRSYGHWWIEVDGVESYGWWPNSPMRTRALFVGVPGVLNGGAVDGASRAPQRDPNHGLPADYEFHPVLVRPSTDEDLREGIRQFAGSFRGEWRWSVRPTMNCRLFQLALFDAVGLVDGSGNYHSRGSGCPALARVRRGAAHLTGRRYWPKNLPVPGQRVADVLAAP